MNKNDGCITEDMYRTILDHVSGLLVLFDRNGNIFHCNNRFSEVYGTGKINTSVHSIEEWSTAFIDLEDIFRIGLKENHFEKIINIEHGEDRKQAVVKFGPVIVEGEILGGYMMINYITKVL